MSQSKKIQAARKVCTKDTVSEAGFNVWYTGEHDEEAPNVDIIAVQGLGADPFYTWVHKQTEVLWFRDFLPRLIPHARIATYSYRSDWRNANIKTSIRECGEQLLNVLLQHRIEKRRPLVFIGHSLGGLIIKQALVLADHGEDFKDIRSSTAGIIFLGTPHQGSDAAVYGVWLAKIARHDATLLESLKRDSPALYDIARDFDKSYRKADIVCFYEKEAGSYGPLRTQFVDHQSASLLGKRAMFLNTDHSGLNKFNGPRDENFLLVGPEIERMVEEAPQRIDARYRCTVHLLPRDLVFQRSSNSCEVHAVDTGKAQRHQNRRDDQETRLLETLASDYKSDKNLVSERVSGTCEWFFEDDRFLKWRDSETSRLLWVSAGPGCGKSVLARALIDEKKVCTESTASTICYFFFKDGQEHRTRGANALNALLHQLFENTALIAHALPIYERYGKELRDAFSELWELLLRSAEDSKAGGIICVLDALDESEEQSRHQLIDKLVQFFSHEQNCHNPLKLKFLVTSRPYDDLELKFQRLSGVSTYMRFDGDEKSERIGEDINLVIDVKIPDIMGGFNHEERKRICNRLKEMENRTYLWLFLTIDIIEKSPSNFRRKSDIESLLSNLPAKISDAYDAILKRSTDEAKARILLELIVAAKRPLSLEEANMALAIATRTSSCRSQRDLELWPVETFGSTVRNWCGLFVSIHNRKLFLIHQTAREFLTRRSETSMTELQMWEGRMEIAAAHGTISRICLDYLTFQDVASSHQSRRDECYLFDYAARYWATHYRSQPAELAQLSLNAAMSLCNTSMRQKYWFSIYCESTGTFSSGWTALGIAIELGLAQVAERLIDRGVGVNAQCAFQNIALTLASVRGDEQVVRMLLDNWADINAQSGNNRSALYAASSGGFDRIVRMLLDNGADVNAQGGAYGTALQAASSGGFDRIVRMLLDNGADVNAQCGTTYGTALQAASSGGFDRIVRMLLDKGADVNAQDVFGGNALQAASVRGYDQIVQMLLDRGADINAQSVPDGNALQAASGHGQDRVVQLLLDKGATDVDGKALEVASMYGYDQILQMLLDKGADLYAELGVHSDALNSAMVAASAKGHDQVVRILRRFNRSAR